MSGLSFLMCLAEYFKGSVERTAEQQRAMMNQRRRLTDETAETKSSDDERVNKEQRLKAALYFGVKQISKEVEEEMGVSINAQVLASVSESLCRQAECYAVDLELFAKHAKRTNVNTDDVKLLARRNPTLIEHLNSIACDQTVQKEATKQSRSKSSKSGNNEKGKKGNVEPVIDLVND